MSCCAEAQRFDFTRCVAAGPDQSAGPMSPVTCPTYKDICRFLSANTEYANVFLLSVQTQMASGDSTSSHGASYLQCKQAYSLSTHISKLRGEYVSDKTMLIIK